MKKVSVILPSLNVSQFIEQCLESVIHQTLTDIEIICVDANSTDGTLEIIQKYASEDSRIRLIVSDKKSYGYQMNLGIQSAEGEYIGIVETDDFIPSRMYEDLYNIAVREKADFVKADFFRFISKKSGYERTYNALDPSRAYYGRIICPEREPVVFRLVMNTWSGIYRRDFLLENNINHNETLGASYQDTGFWFKTFSCADRAYFVDKPYYMNRRDNESSSVFNPGKVYVMTEEWHHIYNWLATDQDKFKILIGAYTLKFYHSLLFTYQRISSEHRPDFIKHMSSEMRKLYKGGLYTKEIFTKYEWKRFMLILKNPMQYHRLCETGFSHIEMLPIVERLGFDTIPAKMFRKLDRLLNKMEIMLAWFSYEGIVNSLRRVRYKTKKDFIRKDKING